MAILDLKQVTKPIFENIPEDLQTYSQWVLWKSEAKYNKQKNRTEYSKRPCDNHGNYINWKDPRNLLPFQVVQDAYDKGGFNGIGFVLTENDPFVCIGLNVESIEEIPEDKMSLVNVSYTEKIPTGNGLHIWLKGKKPDWIGTKHNGIEFFGSNRFVTVTGDVYSWLDIEENEYFIEYVSNKYFTRYQQTSHVIKFSSEIKGQLTEDEVLAKLFSSKNGEAAKKIENSWWATNTNGSKSLLHKVLAEEVIREYSIVRYPTPHSSLYYYNKERGIYEEDRSERQISAIIRTKDDLKNSQIREVRDYIKDMSKIVCNINNQYIAVENGLLNLKTFELEKFSPGVFITQKLPTKYIPNAYDDFIHQTLEKVTQGHKPSIHNIHEMFACVLYPEILVPKMFYLYGPRAHNGKSSVLNMIYETFDKNGGNISAVSPQRLATNSFAGASIYGKLANIVDDQPDILIEDSGTLKTIITGGRTEIERKGRDSKNVKFSTICITASNFLPNFKENGKQINRRLHIIPFEYDFSSDPNCVSDSESMMRIGSESAREYVLKLAVDALKRMLRNPASEKLTPNDKSEVIGKQFAEHSDPLGDYFFEFSMEYFEGNQGTRIYEEYVRWCREHYVSSLDIKRFKEEVCNRYNMEWKTKQLKINGTWKSVKGFKSKCN